MRTATETTSKAEIAYREIPATFMAAVVTYRYAYWSREFLALPALEANRRANDLVGYRWFKATDASKRAAVKLIPWHWPKLSDLYEKMRFVVAVRESASECLR